jgi:hypothetical protein
LAHEQWIGIALAGSGPVHATFIVVAAWAWCLIRGNNLWAAEHGLANDQYESMKTNPGRHGVADASLVLCVNVNTTYA